MKTKILELRQDGKTYDEICRILGCSKGTVSYHCGKGQKELTRNRQRKRSADLVILKKVENFQCSRKLAFRAKNFQTVTDYTGKLLSRNMTFNWKDVIEKFGWETTCYLTGVKINLREPKTYEFDHIVSTAKGGSNTLDNLGICCRNANRAKHDMSVEQLINLCKEILEYNSYKVIPLNNVE